MCRTRSWVQILSSHNVSFIMTEPTMWESSSLKNSSNFAESAAFDMNTRHPSSPDQNGIAEQMNRMIPEHVVSMLQHFGVSDGFWVEALVTSVHIINMLSSRPLGLRVPQELWTNSKPNYDTLRIFRCEVDALIPKDDRRKIELRSRKCVFLEYGPNDEIGYRLWDPEQRQIVRSLNVVFNESVMHKTAERPIEVRRVVFFELPTLLVGPTHNTRSVSRVTDISHIESTDSAQPNI